MLLAILSRNVMTIITASCSLKTFVNSGKKTIVPKKTLKSDYSNRRQSRLVWVKLFGNSVISLAIEFVLNL